MGSLRIRSAPIDGTCPLCGAAFSATLDDAIDEREVVCANGHRIQLRDENDSVRRGVNQVERELATLQHTIRRIGRRR